MNILVTGGAGFIGSHIVNHYIQNKHKVVVLDNLSSGQRKFVHPEAIFCQMDIQDPAVADLIKKEEIQIINHHAAQISLSQSVANPLFDAESNILGLLKVLEHAVNLKIRKIIFASTGGALYGELGTSLPTEEQPRRPDSPYGISKSCGEDYLAYYAKSHGLNTTILRYANVYGPHQNPEGEAGVVAIFCHKLLNNESPTIYGDGEQTRDFVFVGDVARANTLALSPEVSGTFNIGTARETTVNELSNKLAKISGLSIKYQRHPARKFELKRSVVDNLKIFNATGWKPETPLEQGLSETFAYFKNLKG